MKNERCAVLSLNEIPPEHQPSIDDLPGDLSRIAYEIEQHRPGQGIEMTLFLAQVFRGQQLYIRNIDALLRKIRDEAIRTEYDEGQTTMIRLAGKYRLSQSRIKQILSQPDSQ